MAPFARFHSRRKYFVVEFLHHVNSNYWIFEWAKNQLHELFGGQITMQPADSSRGKGSRNCTKFSIESLAVGLLDQISQGFLFCCTVYVD